MKAGTITSSCMILAISLISLQPCQASYFEMTLKQDSIYTPGTMNMAMALTKEAKVEGNYNFRVSIYVADKLMRKETLAGNKEKPVKFELQFPATRSRTEAHCRVELFVNGQFIEAKESPLTLWPARTAYFKGDEDKVIWVFDISGKLQKTLENLEVKTIDATFQAARDFGRPAIVFVGQCLDPNSMLVIQERLRLVDNKPVVIFLRQNRFLKNSKVEIPRTDNQPLDITCDMNSPLLEGLNKRDIMKMIDDEVFLKVKGPKKDTQIATSHITKVSTDKNNIYSYLLSIEEANKIIIYCQLPVTDEEDPRHDILLKNLLKFACEVIHTKNSISPNNERERI